MDTHVHFAKYIGKNVWDEENKKSVMLKGVKEHSLLFMDEFSKERESALGNFKIVVEDDREVFENNIPPDLAVVIMFQETVRNAQDLSPEVFLKKVKDIVYEINDIDENTMVKHKKTRERKYLEPRHIIMSSYYAAFKDHLRFNMTYKVAGGLYGKDHATAINALKKVNNYLDTNKVYRERYEGVWNLVKSVNPRSELHI